MKAEADEPSVGQVIADFLEAEDQGLKPDPAAWANRFPGQAAALLEFLNHQKTVVEATTLLREVRAFATGTPLPGALGLLDSMGQGPPTLSVPGYVLQETLGQGGMGVVYKAYHPTMKRHAAIKVLPPQLGADPRRVQRFRKEAQAVAQLRHPNIVAIYNVDESGVLPALVLEYVEGGTLAAYIRQRKRLPIEEAVRIALALARGMDHAHQRNIVHRDLKPANVLLQKIEQPSGQPRAAAGLDFVPKIADFGLAKLADAEGDPTRSGMFMGTPLYMSPEQASGQAHRAGPQADIYAVGAIFYEMLSGHAPFDGPGAQTLQILAAVLTREPPPLRPERPDVPAELERICLRCLSKEPADRYPSAAALAETLTAWLQRREQQPSRIQRAVLVLALTAAAIVGIVALLPGVMRRPPATPPGPTELTRVFRSPAHLWHAIAADLAAQSEGQRLNRRYFTLAHRVNDPAWTAADLDDWRLALTRLTANSEGQSTLQALTTDQAVFAFDLASAGASADDWRLLLRGYPYAVVPEDDALTDQIDRQCSSRMPMLRADWFVWAVATDRLMSRGPWSEASRRDERVRRLAAGYLNEKLDLAAAAADLGLPDPNRLAAFLAAEPQLIEKLALTPLARGEPIARSDWGGEPRPQSLSPFQRLSRELNLGIPYLIP